jgi:endogenous inhibitor of DNA gyrase (YacG/DUF329 family)
MAIRDPFVAYNASSNLEAQMVCGLLLDAGIEAQVIEDHSLAGLWVGGTMAEIHKPQVWIERADVERARPVLTEYEERAAERRVAARDTSKVIDVLCEECGKTSQFPASQQGSVQSCPHCGAYVDVGDDIEFEGWDEIPSS